MDATTLPAQSRPDGDAARPAAIETPMNRWLIHPISRALLPVAIRLGIAPNTVSFAGLACGLGAATAFMHWSNPWLATLGFVLLLGWHVADGLDGKLARATGRASALGRTIDGYCDYLVFIAVLTVLALRSGNPELAVPLGLAGGVAHHFQAAWYEGERQSWLRRAAGIFTSPPPPPPRGGPVERSLDRIQSRFGAQERPVDAVLATHPAARPAYLARSARILRAMALFSADGRSLAIWLACLAGSPFWYWLWELVALSLLAPVFAHALRRAEAQSGG